jgi:hypothetical protein
MKIVTRVLVITALAAALGGCAAGVSPVTGFWYTDVQGPGTVTGNQVSNKTGTATATSILGLFGTGDASIEAAARNGGITKIHHVDYQTKSILGIYATFTTVVKGE